VPPGLRRVRGVVSLEAGSVVPAEQVSYAMNRRLRFAPVKFGNFQTSQQITLDDRILDHPNVPLVFDADPRQVHKRNRQADWPFYAAPPGRSPSVYDRADKYWFPARRHRGRISVSFVGGHVLSTTDPLGDASWDWDYHPPLRL
jgi:prepilin-type processing-associated H-X9-DG protein